MVRVLIADGQEIFRRGLQVVLAAEAGTEVVGEAADVHEAVKLATDLEPDVALVDLRIPGGGGISALRAICLAVPATRILMLTGDEQDADFYEATAAGARGYLLKQASGEEVCAAVRSAADGETPVSPGMASKLMSEFSSLTRRVGMSEPRAQALSERELEVLRLLAKGMTNRQVAEDLFISENTVKNHVRNILDKLQLRSRMLAVMYAVQERLIEPEALREG